MHELSIAAAILDEVLSVAEREHAKRIRCVRLRVGEMSSVVNEALNFAWELATDGTIAERSRLSIERVPVRVYCETCREEREPVATFNLFCGVCGGPAPRISKGLELLVHGIEVDDADTRDRSPARDSQKELDVGARAP